MPAVAVHSLLQGEAIKLAITQKDDICFGWGQLGHLLYQSNVSFFGKMAFVTVDDHPAQRQGSALINHTDHQGQTSTTYFTAINRQYQWAIAQTEQQRQGEGSKIGFEINPVIDDPARKSFLPAGRFIPIRAFFGYLWIVSALAPDNPTDHPGQCIQMASQIPPWLTRIKLLESISDGQITPKIITVVFLTSSSQPFGFFLAVVAGATTGFFCGLGIIILLRCDCPLLYLI